MESTLRSRVPAGTRLIETFRWEPEAGFINLDQHLARMERSARALGFDYEDLWALYMVQARGERPLRCRLTLGEDGFDFSTAAFAPITSPWAITLSDQRLRSDDMWLQHKTTQRQVYDLARASLPEGVDEVLFLNERNELCEGTITNLFVTLADGRQITPPLSSGVLPGILRQSLLEGGQVEEEIVTVDMLQEAQAIHMGNSLRGLIKAELI